MGVLNAAAAAAPQGVPFVRSGLRHGVQSLFGTPFDASIDPGDPGLFGPGSATWRLLGEPCALPMGFRALTVQLLHPVALEAVHRHGSFQQDFLGRVKRTGDYLQLTNFGSTGQALMAARAIQAIHARVTGTTRRGEPYSASDPLLLGWVGMTFTESTLAVHRAFGTRRLDQQTADRFVAEQAVANALLDPRVDLAALADDPRAGERLRAGEVTLPLIEDGVLPTEVAGLDARLAAFLPELELRELGEAAFRWLLDPPNLDAAQRRAWRVFVASTLATMPPAWRALIGQPVRPVRDRLVKESTRALLGTFRVLHGPLAPRSDAMRRVAN